MMEFELTELDKKRADIGLFTSSGPSHDKLERKIDKSEPREIIFYKDNLYAIRYNELRNIGLDLKYQIEDLCFDKGLYNPVFFGMACHHCNNAAQNLPEDIAMKKGAMVIVDNISSLNWGCVYQGDPNIKIASVFTSINKKNLKFYAIQTDRCAFYDSLISCVAEKGWLDNYKSYIEFDFKPITDFNQGQKIPKEFLFKEVNKKLPKEKEKKKFWFF